MGCGIRVKCLFCAAVGDPYLPLTLLPNCDILMILRSAASEPQYWPSDPTKVKSGKPVHRKWIGRLSESS
jgi:hypothetical protein